MGKVVFVKLYFCFANKKNNCKNDSKKIEINNYHARLFTVVYFYFLNKKKIHIFFKCKTFRIY